MSRAAMSYRSEFPDFDYEPPLVQLAAWQFEDSSWGAEGCPSFRCDVFVIWTDYADLLKREFLTMARFVITDELETVLETDDWEDVRAFVEEGRRDFPPYQSRPAIDVLTATFAQYRKANALPDGDATELLAAADLTEDQRQWLSGFVARWEQEAAEDPRFYDRQTVVKPCAS